MAVAKNQIEEVFEKLKLWVPDESTRVALLLDLSRVKAFEKNKSYRETIKALSQLNSTSLAP